MVALAKANLQSDSLPSTKRLLLLDDEPYNIDVLTSVLKSLQLRNFDSVVDTCYDAEKALNLISNSIKADPESGLAESEYCLILSDLNMPIVDGYDFARMAR